MKIRFYGKVYNIRKELLISSKRTLSRILAKVHEEADAHNLPEYYQAFIIAMYLTSASILDNIADEDIKKITEKGSGE